jgi:ligand-binding sensor domain-containing protein
LATTPGSPGTITKMMLARGPWMTLASLSSVTQFAVGRDAAFMATARDIMKVDLAGGAPVPLAPGQPTNQLVIDAANVYWINAATGAVMKVAVTGGDPVMLAQSSPASTAITIDATNVYWIDALTGAVMRVGIDDGLPAVVVFSMPAIHAASVAADASGLYWTDVMGNVLVLRAGGNPPPQALAYTGSSFASGIALDATSVYWIGGDDAIYRAPKPTGAP